MNVRAVEAASIGVRSTGQQGRRGIRQCGAAILLTLSVALTFVIVSVALSTAANAADKADKPAAESLKISPKVSKALQGAMDAINKKDYDGALKKVGEADAVEKKTAFDQFKIDDVHAYVFTSQNIVNPEVIAIFEKSLTTPEFLEPDMVSQRLQHLNRWAYNANDYAKAIEWGQRQLAIHPDDLGTLNVVGLAQYNIKDYKSARASFELAVATKEQVGAVPDEQWLRLIPSCAGLLNDEAGYAAGYGKLVRYYPKTEYWQKLLDRTLDVEKNDLAILYVFRLMADVGALNKPLSYLEYSDRAVEKAMPGEALTVLESGFEKKILGVSDKDKAAQQQKLADVKRKAQADRAQLPDIEKEAASPKAGATGQLTAGLGLAYFSFGMYEQAVTALDAGIKKGGLKNAEDYRMVLGIAQLRTGQKEAARASFQSIPATSPFARVANLWAIRTYN
jgi:tetratricopeptide (TPR) repeat protein